MSFVKKSKKVKKILFLVAIFIAGGLAILQHNFSYAAGINYSELASLSGNRFSADGLEVFVGDLKNEYVPTALANITETFSSLTPTVANLRMGLDFINNASPNSALALTSSNGIAYKLTINLAKLEATHDKNVKINDLFFTIINHELMHAVMFDVTTNGMLGKRDWNTMPVTELVDEFPKWFYEGIAQAAGGGAEHCFSLVHDFYYRLPLSRREAATKEWLAKFYWLGYEAYAQGYIATLYLGFLAGDGQSLTAENIASGLNLILQDLSDGYSFSETINRRTRGKYADIEDMKAKFANDAYQFSIDYVEAIDTDDPGAGSVASTGGLKAKASVLHSGRHSKSNFFTLETSKLGEADNSALLNGIIIATGGGNTKTERIKRNGQLNEDASELWPAPIGTQYQYIVEHYLEDDDGNYVLNSSERLVAPYGTTVQAAAKRFQGFVVNSSHAGTMLNKVIKGNGQSLKVYYQKRAASSDSRASQPVNQSAQSSVDVTRRYSTSAQSVNEAIQSDNTADGNQTAQPLPKTQTTDPVPQPQTTENDSITQSSTPVGTNWLPLIVTIGVVMMIATFVMVKKIVK